MKLLKAKEKKERALGTRLGLKAFRSSSPKSALARRPFRPGVHGKKRARAGSEFKQQLMEKQKIKLSYGLNETQITKVFETAAKAKQSILESILNQLELRLDNAVYRAGLSPSRIVARQSVSHGHFTVNGRKVTIPSFKVKIGDVIAVRSQRVNAGPYKELAATLKKSTTTWIKVDAEKLSATVTALPHDIELPCNVNMVIDYYSR